jgi:hypothetical protein
MSYHLNISLLQLQQEKYDRESLRRQQEEADALYAREKHEQSVQRLIDGIIKSISEQGVFELVPNKFICEEICDAYNFLRQQGFTCRWEHDTVTISV